MQLGRACDKFKNEGRDKEKGREESSDSFANRRVCVCLIWMRKPRKVFLLGAIFALFVRMNDSRDAPLRGGTGHDTFQETLANFRNLHLAIRKLIKLEISSV